MISTVLFHGNVYTNQMFQVITNKSHVMITSAIIYRHILQGTAEKSLKMQKLDTLLQHVSTTTCYGKYNETTATIFVEIFT